MDVIDAYPQFAARLRATGLLSDPWADGKPRFRQQAILLDNQDLAALYEAAESVVAVVQALVTICAGDLGWSSAGSGSHARSE
jgi:hypothetical protein